HLLHTLVDSCAKPESCPASRSSVGECEEILLDMEMDGSRYLLVRLSKPGSRVQLSPREQEIVRMVAEGHPNKIIADVLNISPWTVCTYLRRIFAKLGVTTRAAMVARTPEIGWTRERSGPEARAQDGRTLDHVTSYEPLEHSRASEGSKALHHAQLRRSQ